MNKKYFFNCLLFPLKCIEFIIFSAIFLLMFIILQPFIWCIPKGKKNIQKNDEARVFVTNHYEIFGPVAVFFRFPYKFRPWVIDKMCNEKTIEEQMSIGLYNNYKWIPKFLKVIFVKTAKRFILFIIRFAKPISVSRDNLRANLKTMQDSTDVLNNKTSIVIFPEKSSVKQGVGEFMTGFETLGKYYYQKTGKRISFYPVFISKKKNSMYFEKPIIFNPNNDPIQEKQRIVNELHNAMVDSYLTHEKSGKKS